MLAANAGHRERGHRRRYAFAWLTLVTNEMSSTLKTRAKNLRNALESVLRISVSRSQSLELVAKEENFPNWDAACASYKSVCAPQAGITQSLPDQVGVREARGPAGSVAQFLDSSRQLLLEHEAELRAVEITLDLTAENLRDTALRALKDCLLHIRSSAGNPKAAYLLSDSAHNLPQALLFGDMDQIRMFTVEAVHGVRKARLLELEKAL